MISRYILAFFAGSLASFPLTSAGFSSSSSTNVAVYWGQNSINEATGPYAQQRLSAYCSNTEIDVIPLAFLTAISNLTLNFANAGDNCTAISGSNLFSCPQLEEDITLCQNKYGKTILLSVGGSTYTEGGFSSSSAAVTAATNIWSIFGPPVSGSSVPRPFGSAVIDGFDFDFETTVSNVAPFANQLRSLMTACTSTTGRQYFLTAAPQCPYPDAADNQMLNGSVYFDAIFIQFYNNYCGLQSFAVGSTTQNNFNFATWDNWAKTVSLNPNVKVMLGIPGASGAAGSGYESGSTLAAIISYSKSFSSFGGVMIWDMSQLSSNPGFLDAVASDLGAPASGNGGGGTTTTTTSPPTTSPPTTLTTVTTKQTTNTTISGACGATYNVSCAAGYCCSAYGYCGTSSAYCGTGCQRAFGTCS